MSPFRAHRMHLILVISLGWAPSSSRAQRSWIVTPDGVGADAPTIQAAVDSAQPGDAVLLTFGRYTWSTQKPSGESMIRMSKPVAMRGLEFDPRLVVLDAEGMGRILECSNVGHIDIEWITFGNGSISSLTTNTRGGAILASGNSNPTIQYCVFSTNVSESPVDGGGGAIACDSAFVLGCRFVNNRAGGPAGDGGAVVCGAASFSHCRFISNAATGNSVARGGAISGRGISLSDCVFLDCSSTAQQDAQGGAVCGAAFVGWCEFGRCSASGSLGRGGGICGATSVSHTVFYENRASTGTAVFDEASSNLTDCAILRNSGGPAIDIATGVIANCVLVANEALEPGGVGGIATSSASINSTIVCRTAGLACGGGPAQAWYCCDLFGNAQGDTFCGVDGGGNFSADPLFCTDPVVTHRVDLFDHSPCVPGHHPPGAQLCSIIGGESASHCNVPVGKATWSAMKRRYR